MILFLMQSKIQNGMENARLLTVGFDKFGKNASERAPTTLKGFNDSINTIFNG